MIGSELLVAPQYKKSSLYVDVFLPGGVEWVHVWTNLTYLGEVLVYVLSSISISCAIVFGMFGVCVGGIVVCLLLVLLCICMFILCVVDIV